MLLSCHIIGLNARFCEKIAGVTLHCLDCQAKDQALSVSQSAKYTLHMYFAMLSVHVEENIQQVFANLKPRRRLYIWTLFSLDGT